MNVTLTGEVDGLVKAWAYDRGINEVDALSEMLGVASWYRKHKLKGHEVLARDDTIHYIVEGLDF